MQEDQLLRAIGRNVRSLRIQRKLTQEETAHLAQIDPKHLQKLERGIINVTARTLARLAATFKVNPTKLLQD